MSEELVITVRGDSAQFTRTMGQVDAAIKRAQGGFGNFRREGVSSMQATSGAIRLVEGDITRNVRAVEKFISSIPGVGKAMQAIFPIVGGIAFAGMIAKIGAEMFNTV